MQIIYEYHPDERLAGLSDAAILLWGIMLVSAVSTVEMLKEKTSWSDAQLQGYLGEIAAAGLVRLEALS